MNGILGMSDLLLKTDQTPNQRRFTESLHRSAQHLLGIINSILDLSKIEAQKFELENLEFLLHHTLEDTVLVFAEPAQRKGLELVCHIESTVPSMAYGDPGRLRQILTNLIGNAIKFTPMGEIYVHAFVSRENPETFELRVEVSDSGIGIPGDAQSKIFDAFSQADSSTTRKFGGTGLGLTITKYLVELMGGEIQVSSKEGQGSTFEVRLPLAKSPLAHLTQMPAPAFHNFRVLIVDNHARSQLAIRDLFPKDGVQVEMAANGPQTLNLLHDQHQRFDAILINQTLPEMDGIDLAQRLKAHASTVKTPLLLLTPWTITKEELQRASQVGFQSQLLKPVRRADLYEQLVALTNSQALPGVEAHSPPFPTPRKHFGHASVLLAEDHEVNQEIVKAMAEHLGLRLQLVNNGAEAVKAWVNGAFDLVLMDWQMPEMDGLEATKEIRRLEGSRDAKGQSQDHNRQPATSDQQPIPIIAITAHASPQDRKTCLDAGTNDVMPKPFSLEQLREKLEQWLPQAHVQEGFTPPNKDHGIESFNEVSQPIGEQDIFNPSALDQIRSLQRPDAPDIVDKVVTKYIVNTAKLLAELQEGLRQMDRTALHHIAHTLKSSSANVGAIRLSEKCKTLDHLARTTSITEEVVALVHDIAAEYETVRPILATHCTGEPS